MPNASLLPRAAVLAAAVVMLFAAPACALAAGGESTPVDLSGSGDGQGAHVGTGGGSLVRTIVGLAVVIGVIYGVAWVLKQVKAGREERPTGGGLASVASVPLGPNRSLHLVRAGRELVLVGVGEHGVTPIRAYDEAAARAAGLVDEEGELLLPPPEAAPAARPATRPRLALPAGAATAANLLDRLRARTVRR